MNDDDLLDESFQKDYDNLYDDDDDTDDYSDYDDEDEGFDDFSWIVSSDSNPYSVGSPYDDYDDDDYYDDLLNF